MRRTERRPRTSKTGQAAASLDTDTNREQLEQAPVRAAHRKAWSRRLEEMLRTSRTLAELSEHLTGLGRITETTAHTRLLEELLPRQMK